MPDISYDLAANRLIRDGFLILEVPPVVEGQLTRVIETAHSFFREPNDTKMQARFPKDMGYRPFGGEYSKSPSSPDQVESFTVTPGVIRASDIESGAGRRLCEIMLSCYDAFELIAEALTVELANSISRTQNSKKLRGEMHRWSRLQLNYSRPVEVTTEFINELHEDGALLTIAHARQPGLELKISETDVRQIANSTYEILALPGDIAWLLSGGLIRPMFHRVRPEPTCAERVALLFFGDINPRLCEPWVKNEINHGINVGELVLKNPKRFGLQEWDFDEK